MLEKVAKESSVRWVVIISASLFTLLSGVFFIGWNLRGQTAKIKAIEVKTDEMSKDIDIHYVEQKQSVKELNIKIGKLKDTSIAQTVILKRFDKKSN